MGWLFGACGVSPTKNVQMAIPSSIRRPPTVVTATSGKKFLSGFALAFRRSIATIVIWCQTWRSSCVSAYIGSTTFMAGLDHGPIMDKCQVEDLITSSDLVRALRADPRYRESRPHLEMSHDARRNHLTAGPLSSPETMPVAPYEFHKHDGNTLVQIFYVGMATSYHPGIVHGGFLATMLDEALARCAFLVLPNRIGVTANLNVNYLRLTKGAQALVLWARSIRSEGRKAWVEGWIEPLTDPGGQYPGRLVEATALFVEPKQPENVRA